MKTEDKMNILKDRGQILKIEDSPLKNQVDGQPNYKPCEDQNKGPFTLGEGGV